MLPSLVFLVLRDAGEKLWAALSSLGVPEELGIPECDLEIVLTSADISEDDLEALLEAFEAFIGQASSLVNLLGGNSTLEQKLLAILSTLGVSDQAVQAAILGEVQHQLSVSGSDLVADLQAFLPDLEVPNGVLLAQVQALLKSANISTADLLAVAQHVQGFASGLNCAVADLMDLLGLVGVSDAGAMDAFHTLVGFLRAQGVSMNDVKLGVATAVDFFKSLSATDLLALFADMHGLLVVSGVPHGGPQAAMYSFLNEAKALKSLLLS